VDGGSFGYILLRDRYLRRLYNASVSSRYVIKGIGKIKYRTRHSLCIPRV
jgi:hypothetical protein